MNIFFNVIEYFQYGTISSQYYGAGMKCQISKYQKQMLKEPHIISKWYDILPEIGQTIEIDRNG